MQKQYRLGIPSFITVETEDGSWIGEKDAQKTEKEDVVVTYETTPEAEEVWLTADQTKVKTIKLRWNTPVNKKSRILGGSWERTYGDVDWKGVSGSRFMPWYFLAAVGETVTGYGVKVRPSAMCFWQADTRGITLVMDVRCGGIGVQLSGRKLRAAQIVAMQTEGMGTFESAREFCKVMCTDPIFPDYPVYGSNNWYYAYGDSSEEEILQDTDYIVELTQGVDNTETKLEQSQREDDTLTNLRTALENCTLTATMDGTITALDATVGAVCSGTVATIQDMDNLTVEVTIPASSVGRLKTGLQCNITSDATDDTVTGTLTRIDPVANDSGSFGATVTVNGQDSGLLVGIPAKVEIVISTKVNVFTVPRDAVGTNDDGSTYVLRKTGGEGVDMTFEQVAVTEGDTNDYYVEITGSDLNEGDVIRATADLTQGIESGTSDSDVQMMENGDLYVGDGSNMPASVTVARTDDAGGPGGGGPGGAPDGGPGGQ